MPSIAHELSLIIFDPQSHRESFIRQVAFRDGAERFGFVVPTPTLPTVAKVERSPFDPLRKNFPFSPPPLDEGFGSGSGHLSGGGQRGVTVLSEQKVGSFTAFVLSATDPKAFARWLVDQNLSSTAAADTWLAHYVKMRFYFVAMRYDPPEVPGSALGSTISKAETFRVSFSTPLPYYPYYEPKRETKDALRDLRALDLWMVSTRSYDPVSKREEDPLFGGKTSWVQPMRRGQSIENARALLESTLANELLALLPGGELRVETFADQKGSREGFGDVLFAPTEPTQFTEAELRSLKPLLGILDRKLEP